MVLRGLYESFLGSKSSAIIWGLCFGGAKSSAIISGEFVRACETYQAGCVILRAAAGGGD